MGAIEIVPSLVVDGHERFALVMLSADTISVYGARVDSIPSLAEFERLSKQGVWVRVRRSTGEELSVLAPAFKGSVYHYRHPDEEEAGELAMAIALHMWPEWCPQLRETMRPRTDIIPLRSEAIFA